MRKPGKYIVPEVALRVAIELIKHPFNDHTSLLQGPGGPGSDLRRTLLRPDGEAKQENDPGAIAYPRQEEGGASHPRAYSISSGESSKPNRFASSVRESSGVS
ncbi:hypothetical protein GCM10009603_50670 [Nocardiopsis exhalans]